MTCMQEASVLFAPSRESIIISKESFLKGARGQYSVGKLEAIKDWQRVPQGSDRLGQKWGY